MWLLLACRPDPEPVVPTGRVPPRLDLAAVTPEEGVLRRLHGSASERGSFGVPVAGGGDVDGDGFADAALSAMRAAPDGVEGAGTVYLWFGTGELRGAVDSATDPDVVRIHGQDPQEMAGSETWMADVTGDGLADLLIARQNANPGGVVGAGSLSILRGDPALRGMQELRLGEEPPGVLTLAGDQVYGRVGIWVRTGDVTGDGLADVVVGADQEDGHQGAVYVVEGGPHLAADGTIGLGGPELAGHVLRVAGPAEEDAHFGGCLNVGDLDGDGLAELLVGATINRASASLGPAEPGGETHGAGGVLHGRAYVVYDEAIGAPPWSGGFAVDAAPGPVTAITGATLDNNFGEELASGDWDADGQVDLFVGDLTGDLSGDARPISGAGVVLWDLADRVGEAIDLAAPPADLAWTRILGAAQGDVFADTAGAGDIDGDGVTDLLATAPDADPGARDGAGIAVVLFGGPRWPAVVDLDHGGLAPASEVEVVEVWGAEGTRQSWDFGDMLAYSGAVADMDGDGLADLVVNEMLGDGLQPDTYDVGNLDLISGAAVSAARQP